jgi:phage terminase small subunit
LKRFSRTTRRGNASIDLSQASEDDWAAIAELSSEASGEVTRTRIKLHDKKGALDSLARHLGMFIDKSEISLVVETREQRIARLRELVEGSGIDEGALVQKVKALPPV